MKKGEIFAFCVVFAIALAGLISGIILGMPTGIFLGAATLILALSLLFSKLSQKEK